MNLFSHLLAVADRSVPAVEISNLEALLSLLLALWLFTRLRANKATTAGAATNSIGRKRALFSAPHEFAPVRVHDFHGLDERRYEEMQRRLEDVGFQYFGDVENLSLSAVDPMLRTAVCELASGDGVVSAFFRQLRMRRCSRFRGWLRLGKDCANVLEMSTEFSDGSFLSTSNSAAAEAEMEAPGIERIELPIETAIEEAAVIHRRRVSEIVSQRPGVVPVPVRTARAIRDSAARAHSLRCAEFSKRAGAELQEIPAAVGGMPWLDYFPDAYAVARKITALRRSVN